MDGQSGRPRDARKTRAGPLGPPRSRVQLSRALRPDEACERWSGPSPPAVMPERSGVRLGTMMDSVTDELTAAWLQVGPNSRLGEDEAPLGPVFASWGV